MAKMIVIEGPDRCGKATQSKLLCAHLISLGYKAKVIEVPIKDIFTYPTIYWMLKNGLAKKFPKVFQRLQVFNRQIFQSTKMKHYDELYDFLIFDRWSLSTVAYGMAEGLDKEYVEKLYRTLRKPDMTFILLGASHKHEAEDVYEADTSLQLSVRVRYRDWANEFPDDHCIIDCTQSKEDISSQVINKLKDIRLV